MVMVQILWHLLYVVYTYIYLLVCIYLYACNPIKYIKSICTYFSIKHISNRWYFLSNLWWYLRDLVLGSIMWKLGWWRIVISWLLKDLLLLYNTPKKKLKRKKIHNIFTGTAAKYIYICRWIFAVLVFHGFYILTLEV